MYISYLVVEFLLFVLSDIANGVSIHQPKVLKDFKEAKHRQTVAETVQYLQQQKEKQETEARERERLQLYKPLVQENVDIRPTKLDEAAKTDANSKKRKTTGKGNAKTKGRAAETEAVKSENKPIAKEKNKSKGARENKEDGKSSGKVVGKGKATHGPPAKTKDIKHGHVHVGTHRPQDIYKRAWNRKDRQAL